MLVFCHNSPQEVELCCFKMYDLTVALNCYITQNGTIAENELKLKALSKSLKFKIKVQNRVYQRISETHTHTHIRYEGKE